MSKKLRVTIESNLRRSVEVNYVDLDGDESEEDLQQIAADVFSNYCSYGYDVVDSKDAPAA